MINLVCDCIRCQTNVAMTVYEKDLNLYYQGNLIQKCFPYLSAAEREMIITGFCPTCQEKIYSQFEDEGE